MPSYQLYVYNIQLYVPTSSHGGQNISAIYKNIYLLYIRYIIIITNMKLHVQYLKLYIYLMFSKYIVLVLDNI